MIFSSWEYLLFFVVMLILLSTIKIHALKKAVLLIGSYYFYSVWDYRFVLLVLVMTLINHVSAVSIDRATEAAVRKRWLIFSVIANLAILGFFKYFNFFIDSANGLLDQFGMTFPLLSIVLPVGISFITFEVMSYTIDVYKRDIKPSSIWDFSLLIVFFPHLIAGPILKPRHFLPQMARDIVIKRSNLIEGGQIFIFGLVKKIIIADHMAMFVDPVFASPGEYSPLTVWLAVIAYAVQIYCDFSGYSDMAIGSAKCMGIDIPRNFNMPYLSRSVTEFWRRWHISLSSWLREYLYFSLGGNRKGPIRANINLILVMLLGGLWHGASWNFVLWGLLHGLALVIHKLYFNHVLKKQEINHWLYKAAAWALTFIFVCVTWVFFRSQSFEHSLLVLRKMFLIDTGGLMWFYPYLGFVLVLVLAGHMVGVRLKTYPSVNLTTFRGLFILFFVLLALLLLMPTASTPFIYFQF